MTSSCRKANNAIQVVNLHEKDEGMIPNPVLTFEQAFDHYRKEISFHFVVNIFSLPPDWNVSYLFHLMPYLVNFDATPIQTDAIQMLSCHFNLMSVKENDKS